MDYEYLDSLLNVLVEWASLEDEEAYNELRNHPLTYYKDNDINCSKNYVFVQCGNLLGGLYQNLFNINSLWFLVLQVGL